MWDEQLARTGAELLAARLALVDALRPYVGKAYETVARGASREDAEMDYRSSFDLGAGDDLEAGLRSALADRRGDELDRGISLVGPHRDELLLSLGNGLGDGQAAGARLRVATASPGRWRSRSGWRPTTCSAPTATTRS